MSTALLGTGDASAASASRASPCDVTLAWLGDGERLSPLMALGVALLDLDLDEDDFAGVAVAAGELRTSTTRHETKSDVRTPCGLGSRSLAVGLGRRTGGMRAESEGRRADWKWGVAPRGGPGRTPT